MFSWLTVAENSKKAYAWRAETLRLFRENQGLKPLQLKADSLGVKSLKKMCASVSDKIILGDSSAVLREVTDEEREKRRAELNDICRGFCLLALELGCQKSQLEVVDDNTLFGTAFSMSSVLHQPHRSMGMDEDDTKFDGHLPHAVLVPALRIFGDANGDNLEAEKIISRSLVYIFDEVSLTKVHPFASEMIPVPSERSESPSADSVLVDSGGSKKRKRALTESPSTDLRALLEDQNQPPSTTIQPLIGGAHKRISRDGEDGRLNESLRPTDCTELVIFDEAQSKPVLQKMSGDLQVGIFVPLAEQLRKAAGDPQTPPANMIQSHHWIPDSTVNKGTTRNMYRFVATDENEERKVAIFH